MRESEVGRAGSVPPNHFGQALVGCPNGPIKWAGPIGPGGIFVFSNLIITLELYQILNNKIYL